MILPQDNAPSYVEVSAEPEGGGGTDRGDPGGGMGRGGFCDFFFQFMRFFFLPFLGSLFCTFFVLDKFSFQILRFFLLLMPFFSYYA